MTRIAACLVALGLAAAPALAADTAPAKAKPTASPTAEAPKTKPEVVASAKKPTVRHRRHKARTASPSAPTKSVTPSTK